MTPHSAKECLLEMVWDSISGVQNGFPRFSDCLVASSELSFHICIDVCSMVEKKLYDAMDLRIDSIGEGSVVPGYMSTGNGSVIERYMTDGHKCFRLA